MKRQQERIEENSNHFHNKNESMKKNISVGAQMSETVMGLTYWRTIQFCFQGEKKKV